MKKINKQHSHFITSLLIIGIILILIIDYCLITDNMNNIKVLQSQLENMPHKYCHNETINEKFIIDEHTILREFPIDSKIMCDGGIEEYNPGSFIYYSEMTDELFIISYNNFKSIYNCYKNIGKFCFIEYQKEVCEIR